MKAPISRVLPTPVASAKQSEGKSRSKSVSVGYSVRMVASAAARSAVLGGGAISVARSSSARDSCCGGRRLRRPVMELTWRFMRLGPQGNSMLLLRRRCRRVGEIGVGEKLAGLGRCGGEVFDLEAV